MKTLSLRSLLRDPLAVKRATRAGQPVQITDHGRPLWVIRAATAAPDPAADEQRRTEIEAEFAVMLREPARGPSLARIVLDSRR